jgi:hypothetical protein
MALRLFTSRLLSAGERSVISIVLLPSSGIAAVDNKFVCDSCPGRFVDIETALTARQSVTVTEPWHFLKRCCI